MTALLLVFLACEAEKPAAKPEAAAAAAAPAPPPEAPAVVGQASAAPTQKGLYTVRWRTTPPTIPLSELFVVEVELRDAQGAPVEQAVVGVDARMPSHGHGMATRPLAVAGQCDAAGACVHPGGIYRTEGMKFHMPGEWVVLFDVKGPAGADTLEVVYRL